MDFLRRALLVGAGGFLGSILRYGTATLAARALPTTTVPIGTLTVNVLGCLLIGTLSGTAEARGTLTPDLWLFLAVGVLGGFTTFSAFGNEVVLLTGSGDRLGAMGLMAAHLVLGIGAAAAGYGLAQGFWR